MQLLNVHELDCIVKNVLHVLVKHFSFSCLFCIDLYFTVLIVNTLEAAKDAEREAQSS